MRIKLSTYPNSPEVAIVKVSESDLPSGPLAFSHSVSIKDLYLTRPAKPFNPSAEEAEKYKFKAIRDYGKRLFKALFPSDSTTPSRKLWASLSSQSGRILLIIDSNDPTFNIDEIPWEYAYADAPLLVKYNFVRMVYSSRCQDEFQFKPPLHLFLVAPDPIILSTCDGTDNALYLDEQYMNFINCFKFGKKTLTLERVFPATLESLKDIIKMKDAPKPVLHFMGHCMMIEEEPALLFEKEGGSVHYIRSCDLAAMSNFQLVFLAGCQTYKLA
ncbi:hypothetical protein BC937DRAFT_90701 [Endogone sp. FLAS-F59071]|nr:hypothetical protein BC937DRAFT_90701 [Endogone sp. FLAS-F59071]|eukprot:RUS16875.1 hypothetical protein BC937DRAFT_90701 [Endogone sp. FLAS-F59071]